MSQQERTRVAIVGAGIVGLTLAIALNAFDKERKLAIDIYENASELAEIGAGINVWPRTLAIFKQIGVEDALIPLLDHIPDLEPRIIFGIRKGDEKNGYQVYDTMNNGGALRVHRAHLQNTLIQHLPLPGSKVTEINSICGFHLGHNLIDYSHHSSSGQGPLTLHFSDGKPSRTCDILVGADGIKSTLRHLFLPRLPNPEKYLNCYEPKWKGLLAYRGLVPKEKLEAVSPGHRALTHPGLMYSGKSAYAVVYPVSNGKFINVVAIVHDNPTNSTVWPGPWRMDVTQSEFFEVYKGWDEEVLDLIRCVDKPTKWALHALDHLDVYAKGRVFLMGDAAHAMLPHLGAGAHVGMEDAYILASLITHSSTPIWPSTQHVGEIANIYNTMRIPRAVSMSNSTDEAGYLCNLENPGLEEFKVGDHIPKELLIQTARTMEKKWAWTTTYADEDRIKAISLLEGPRAVL
ncbi:4-aminobenzoate hydroxylase [Agaricus bisporus var. bisporus H97]|uniref:4-aminobenzoate hydroxylase n=1 Tax=Agaricus bisporus var. bisporus (strain H97 / ATCC MYA-4626 / FGSC 10389) TaxID=936046 RepID=UPI00029F6EFA|nr:4-aminobenzoate hydroxylase [Agaricus bisporus var. bisporus H97]EKV43267.1 4-aminobenzoate hydroxylase [Agaricus bisporus var. bisporus H97]